MEQDKVCHWSYASPPFLCFSPLAFPLTLLPLHPAYYVLYFILVVICLYSWQRR